MASLDPNNKARYLQERVISGSSEPTDRSFFLRLLWDYLLNKCPVIVSGLKREKKMSSMIVIQAGHHPCMSHVHIFNTEL